MKAPGLMLLPMKVMTWMLFFYLCHFWFVYQFENVITSKCYCKCDSSKIQKQSQYFKFNGSWMEGLGYLYSVFIFGWTNDMTGNRIFRNYLLSMNIWWWLYVILWWVDQIDFLFRWQFSPAMADHNIVKMFYMGHFCTNSNEAIVAFGFRRPQNIGVMIMYTTLNGWIREQHTGKYIFYLIYPIGTG